MVRRPPHPGVLDHLAAAGVAAHPPVALALAAVACAALFPPLARGAFGEERARWGSIWFGVGTATLLFTARLPFAIGVAFGLAALLGAAAPPLRAGRSSSRSSAPLGSPVAGLFLAMAGVAVALAAERRPRQALGGARDRRRGVHPAGRSCPGRSPRAAGRRSRTSAYLPIPAFAIICLILLPREQRALRWGIVLYGIGATIALPLETPMGGNAVRLGRAVRRPGDAVRALGPAGAGASLAAAPLLVAGFASLALLDVVAGGARRDQVPRGPGREVRLLRAAAAVPLHAARPAPHRDPVHAQPLGGRRDRARRAARARLAAPARHRPQPDLLQGPDQPAHLRELAGRQRRALRRAAEREARQELLRRARR